MSDDKNWLRDYSLGQQGIHTGGAYNSLGIAEYEQKKRMQVNTVQTTVTPRRTKTPVSLEESIIAWLGVAAWVGVSYLLIMEADLNWLVSVIAGLFVGKLFQWLLEGPLYFAVKIISWSLTLSFFGGIAYFIWLVYMESQSGV